MLRAKGGCRDHQSRFISAHVGARSSSRFWPDRKPPTLRVMEQGRGEEKNFDGGSLFSEKNNALINQRSDQDQIRSGFRGSRGDARVGQGSQSRERHLIDEKPNPVVIASRVIGEALVRWRPRSHSGSIGSWRNGCHPFNDQHYAVTFRINMTQCLCASKRSCGLSATSLCSLSGSGSCVPSHINNLFDQAR